MLDKIKKYYEQGFWSIEMVRNAVKKGKITVADYTKITGKTY